MEILLNIARWGMINVALLVFSLLIAQTSYWVDSRSAGIVICDAMTHLWHNNVKSLSILVVTQQACSLPKVNSNILLPAIPYIIQAIRVSNTCVVVVIVRMLIH